MDILFIFSILFLLYKGVIGILKVVLSIFSTKEKLPPVTHCTEDGKEIQIINVELYNKDVKTYTVDVIDMLAKGGYYDKFY